MRHADDFYITPDFTIELWLAAVPGAYLGREVLDPCAGAGAILRACRSRGVAARGIELHEGRAAEAGCACGDGLGADWRNRDVVMNPPYRSALAWVQKGVEESRSCAALLRLSFLGSRSRAEFLQQNPPRFIVHVSPRPSFVPGGGTDASEYAWLGWGDLPGAPAAGLTRHVWPVAVAATVDAARIKARDGGG